jgi:hypothetical protein
MPLAETDLEQVEEVTPQEVAADVLRRQRDIEVEPSDDLVPEPKPVDASLERGSGGRRESDRLASQQVKAEHRGQGAIEERPFGAAVQVCVDVHRQS